PGKRYAALGPRRRRFERGHLDGVEPLAQHRLQSIFPATLDVELLPQSPRALEPVRGRPRGGVRPASDLGLQRRERLRPRFALGQGAARGLPRVAGDAMTLLQGPDVTVELGERLLALGEIGAFLLELLADGRDFPGGAQCEVALFRFEPLAPLCNRAQHLVRVLAPGVRHTDRLLDLADPLLNVADPPSSLST